MQTRRDACYCNTFLMKDIGATKAGLFKQYICSMATHFAIKFSDPVLSLIPSKKDIRTLSLLKKDVYFQRFKQVNVFVDRSYYGPYYLSLNVFKASKGSTLYILLYPRHLCRRVYSFRFSVRMFVRSFVRFFVHNSGTFVEFMSKFWLKFL